MPTVTPVIDGFFLALSIVNRLNLCTLHICLHVLWSRLETRNHTLHPAINDLSVLHVESIGLFLTSAISLTQARLEAS